ncbi:MAG TPA: hypothetical protein VNI78_03780 [Vicinamibacterales bacterium]|nr:hypothetical protein [Vicinamibacterales bacterium]
MSDPILPDNRDTFTPPPEDDGPPRILRVGLALALVIAVFTGGVTVGRMTRPEGTWQDRALAAVRDAVESGCGDVQVYGAVITGEMAAKRMDSAISFVRQLATLQGFTVFAADSWSRGAESAGGAVVVAKCEGPR